MHSQGICRDTVERGIGKLREESRVRGPSRDKHVMWGMVDRDGLDAS